MMVWDWKVQGKRSRLGLGEEVFHFGAGVKLRPAHLWPLNSSLLAAFLRYPPASEFFQTQVNLWQN
jgi:hypothetical protein